MIDDFFQNKKNENFCEYIRCGYTIFFFVYDWKIHPCTVTENIFGKYFFPSIKKYSEMVIDF